MNTFKLQFCIFVRLEAFCLLHYFFNEGDFSCWSINCNGHRRSPGRYLTPGTPSSLDLSWNGMVSTPLQSPYPHTAVPDRGSWVSAFSPALLPEQSAPQTHTGRLWTSNSQNWFQTHQCRWCSCVWSSGNARGGTDVSRAPGSCQSHCSAWERQGLDGRATRQNGELLQCPQTSFHLQACAQWNHSLLLHPARKASLPLLPVPYPVFHKKSKWEVLQENPTTEKQQAAST